jgi:hypothetical protein
MGHEVEQIQQKIKSFKRKYYLDLSLRGLILSALILSVYFILAAVVEHNLWLEPWARFVTFFSFFAIAAYCVVRFLREPIQWWIARRGLSEEQSARIIGNRIPGVDDRLLNFIQLTHSKESGGLAMASVVQKSREFAPMSFESIIDLKENRRFAKYLLIPIALIIGILLFNRSILTDSTDRLIHFTRKYSPAAPFDFFVDQKILTAFYNEDFTFKVDLKGQAVPEEAFALVGNQRIKLEKISTGEFAYTWENLQRPLDIQVEAAGFFSSSYKIDLVNRPELNQFRIDLQFPRYIKRANESLVNVGNLEIPEGTEVTWHLKTGFTDQIVFDFKSDSVENATQRADNQSFEYKRRFVKPDQYEIKLENGRSVNKEKIFYSVDVIKDQHPAISINNLQDSILYQRVLLGGSIGDDYGVTQLSLNYSITSDEGKSIQSRVVQIPIEKNQPQQNFFYNWNVDSLTLEPGYKLEYFLQVWDNDGVNGRKSTKTAVYAFSMPTSADLMVQINKSQNQTEQKIDEGVSKAKDLQQQIEDATQKIKGKQNLNWQDKKMLEDIIQQKKSLDQVVEKLQEENKLLDKKKDAFTEQDKRIKEKAEQIQKLMDELLDEETKKLFEELQKLLKENADINDIQKLLNKLNQNTDNLEKELERTLELFKDMQFDFKMDQAINKLNEQIEKQKDILEQTEKLGREEQQKKQNSAAEDARKQETEELAKDQEDLMKDVQENAEQMEELKKLGEELHKEESVPDQEEMQEILDEQQQSKEQLEQNQPSKATPPQKNSLQKMQQMQQQMESAQNSMSMEMDMENLESLRQIIHSLVKLSYDQESLMKQFNELTPNDPKFNSIAQNQLKLKDDSKVLEDSLLALGKRDPFMGSVITKEIGELNSHMDRVIEANKERRRPQASSEMQASMTAINNLALLLDDHFEMMMQMMANAKPSAGKPKKGQKPSLSQMQQNLNQKIQQLKNSGKSGKQLSEELAEMAAEQERIRKALQEMQEKMEEGGGSPGNQLPTKMEQTEMDLVNKQLTDQLIRRQQEILTRLLETEKSVREQDLDDERKGETAKDYDKEIPKAFEEYLRLKEKEVELLKTVPPKLYPYYKKEVNEYFKRMGK